MTSKWSDDEAVRRWVDDALAKQEYDEVNEDAQRDHPDGISCVGDLAKSRTGRNCSR